MSAEEKKSVERVLRNVRKECGKINKTGAAEHIFEIFIIQIFFLNFFEVEKTGRRTVHGRPAFTKDLLESFHQKYSDKAVENSNPNTESPPAKKSFLKKMGSTKF